MSEWKTYRLSDVVQFNPAERLYKGAIAKKVAMEHLQPFTRAISGYELAVYSGGSKFRNGDTLMARITPCLENGKTAYVSFLDNGEVGFGSTEYIVFRSIEGVTDSKFVYYFVTSPWFRNIAIKSMVGSSGRQRVQQSVLENLEVNIPPLEEQKRIAVILGALDDKIELNRRINANLEEQAQALFKSWFVDFEPFRDSPFVDSELGKIPKGWKVGNLLDIAELFDVKRKPLSSREREKMQKIYPYYGATSIMDFVDNYIFDGIYLLMGEDGSVANIQGFPYLQYVFGKFWPNNHAHVMQGKNGYTTEMLHCLLLRKNITSIVTGAVQPKISQTNMRKILVPLPPYKICSDFVELINPIYSARRNAEKEIFNLSALRDTLLPKLMAGEIAIE